MSKTGAQPLTRNDYRLDPTRRGAHAEYYLVKSRSEPGVEHTVIHNRRPESWGCDCKARVRCAHIDLVAYEEAARLWRAHWVQASDLSLVLTDREFASRPATLTADEQTQWATLGDELARRALSLDAVAALLRPAGLDEVRARGKAAASDLFGEG